MTSSHGISETSPSSVDLSRPPCATAITTAQPMPPIASTVSSHCQAVISRHQAGTEDPPGTARRTASASAPGKRPALSLAASRREVSHGSGRPSPIASANAVMALSTSDWGACPAARSARSARAARAAPRSARTGSRLRRNRRASGQPVNLAARASLAVATDSATAVSPAAPASALIRSLAGPSGTLPTGSTASGTSPSREASSHGGLAGGSCCSSSESSQGGLARRAVSSATGADSSVGEAARLATASSGASCGPAWTAKPAITESMSAEIRDCAARLSDTASTRRVRRSSRPAPVRADTGTSGVSVRPSASSSRRRSSSQSLPWSSGSRSIWLSTTVNTLA
jgi:hypothetical protein